MKEYPRKYNTKVPEVWEHFSLGLVVNLILERLTWPWNLQMAWVSNLWENQSFSIFSASVRKFKNADLGSICNVYSQTKWSVPLKIALMNWLFETWTR